MIKGKLKLFLCICLTLWSCCVAASFLPRFSVNNYRELERKIMNAHDYLENHRRFMKAALGTTLVLFGGSFSTSMMFVHASQFNQDISDWNVSNVLSLYEQPGG